MGVIYCPHQGTCISSFDFFYMSTEEKRDLILKLIKELSERYGVHYKVEDKGVRIDLSDFMRAYSSATEEKDINAFSFLLNY